MNRILLAAAVTDATYQDFNDQHDTGPGLALLTICRR